MKVSTEIDRERKRLFVRFVGRVTYAQVEDMIISSAKEEIICYPLLIDARTVTIDLFPEDVNRLRDLLLDLSTKFAIGPTAVLISDDLSEQGTQLVGMVAQGLCEVRGFANRADAEKWLGWSDS